MKRASIAGGEVATICEAGFGGGGTWNRDGVIVFTPGIDRGLFRVSAEEARRRPSPVRYGSRRGRSPRPLFLPDGRHFVFGIIGGDSAGTYVASLDSPERKRMPLEAVDARLQLARLPLLHARAHADGAADGSEAFELTGEPIRVAEGVEQAGVSAAFAVSASGTMVYWSGARNITQPTWFQRDGTAAGTLGPPAAYMNVALSPDGRQAAIDRFDLAPGIWLLDATRGTATRVTSGGIYESTPVWSPDASAFVFAAARDTPPNLYVKRIGGASDDERLFGTRLQTFPQSWSRDGRYIAYVTIDPKTNSTTSGCSIAPAIESRCRFSSRSSMKTTRASRPMVAGWRIPRTSPGGMEVYVTRFPKPAANGRCRRTAGVSGVAT